MIVENRKHCQYNAVNEQNGAKYTHNVYTAVPHPLTLTLPNGLLECRQGWWGM